MAKKFVISKAVHKSVRVGFVPNPEQTCRNRVEKKGTRRQPAWVIESGSSEHQRVAGESVGFKMVRKRWKKHRSVENLTEFYQISPNLAKISPGFDEISLDPVKISPNLREIASKFGKISPEFRFFHRILENFGRNMEIFQSVRIFWVLREQNQNPIRRNQFLVMKTRRSSQAGRF